MFHFLNRLMRGVVLACWLAAAWVVWTHRDRGKPLVDYFSLWKGSNWSAPEPLPRMPGTGVRMLGNINFQIRTDAGLAWNVGLVGADTNAWAKGAEGRRLALDLREALSNSVVGNRLELAVTVTNSSTRTGLGFGYVDGTNSLLLGWVGKGWVKVDEAACRALPIREQYALRVAERQAREAGLGVWAK